MCRLLTTASARPEPIAAIFSIIALQVTNKRDFHLTFAILYDCGVNLISPNPHLLRRGAQECMEVIASRTRAQIPARASQTDTVESATPHSNLSTWPLLIWHAQRRSTAYGDNFAQATHAMLLSAPGMQIFKQRLGHKGRACQREVVRISI